MAWVRAQAWAAAWVALDNPEQSVLDATIQWHMTDPRFIEKQEDNMSHIQWTIQLRFDPLGDDDKKAFVTAAVTRAASHILAQANLLEGPIQSTIAVYSDDFMKGRKEISLVPDTIGAALAEYNVGEQETLSDEMMEVVGGLSKKKK